MSSMFGGFELAHERRAEKTARFTASRGLRQKQRNDAADHAQDAADRDAGLLPHHKNPDDPWAGSVMRVCEPGCVEHRPVAS